MNPSIGSDLRRLKASYLAALMILCGLFFCGMMSAADHEPNFARDVLPLLKRACLDCHGPEKAKGALRLDTLQAALKGGDNGTVIVPGKPDQSELLRRIMLPADDPEVMPARGSRLSAAQIALIRGWIEGGAVWPDGVTTNTHWSYLLPQRPVVPESRPRNWSRNPIDAFILRKLNDESWQPADAAEPATALRRLSFDLAGLPPNLSDLDEFLQDSREDAYERLIDRLMASPTFGEKWARPWLDLARYADSHGFQRDDLREIWPYRDWVIRALNDDMPFDRFTIEQLAGDLLPTADESQRIATGFNRCTTTNVESGSDPDETRFNQIFDRVNTLGTVWLGTTLECAQCHDHKYDPFTQQDYYQLFAFFNNTAAEAERKDPNVPGSIKFLGPTMPIADPVLEAEQIRLTAKLRDVQQQIKDRQSELEQTSDEWEGKLLQIAAVAPQTHLLEISDFESEAGSNYRQLDDKSILLVDEPPDKDTYTLTIHTQLTDIRAFKLEALADPLLPGGGPGRGDANRPNFILNTFSVAISPGSDAAPEEPVAFKAAQASFASENNPAEAAIDGNPQTGWAIRPRFKESHWATFETTDPVGDAAGATLKVTLVQQEAGGKMIGRLRLSAITGDPHGRLLPAEIIEITRVLEANRTEEQQQRLTNYRLEQDSVAQTLKSEIAKLEKQIQTLKLPSTLVMRELDSPRATHMLVRGNFLEPGTPVQPQTPAVLHQLPGDQPLNRLTLARWLVSPQNPLTARVQVNRWWAELFGRGLVSTVDDFGIKGDPPSHPELLDWLALEFTDGDFSLKRWLRNVVASATYRQSSRITAQHRERDPENHWYARGPRLRLDAESIRDNALAISGLLGLKLGGPPVRPYQPEGLWTKIGGDRIEYVVSPGEDRYRRGIYVVWKRSSPYPSLAAFDAPIRLSCVPKRTRSNTPLQALTLLNDPVYVEAALAFARRIIEECPDASTDGRIKYAFRQCVGREPAPVEVSTLTRLWLRQRESALQQPDAVNKLLGQTEAPPGTTDDEFAAWYALATTWLNLDETMTKE